ncbi:aminotransferase class V-fold PLP-dependent enzyme [Streptomyces seoulensis]|uniref:Aminotransferase class V-fold PLP-dependent enzyme n=1 Tax=Streptomyces seoulensis TaxID=73044 RepID=A0A4P6U034_STRSO|nr:aminotransferase class V-fold PLP-dependent enzyme [Streptomyces seoulensis]QBJ92657.1 aminotransferase class V-fold PLP-dependent enzyme [Streptomyces seoulensis]
MYQVDASFDVERARAETPGVNHVIHLNNAGAGLMPQTVVHAMKSHLELESEVGAYEAAERVQATINGVYDAIAGLLNCNPQEVAIFESASRAWAMAVSSIALNPGDRVLVSSMEYGSNYINLLHMCRRMGVSVEVLPVDSDGVIDYLGIENYLDERVRLIALPHVPMHDGLVNPLVEIGRIARKNGILFLVDACQSVGQLTVDVHEANCDLLVGAGRKFLRGPRGTGFLYARQEVAEKLTPFVLGLDGAEWLSGSYRMAPGARRFENWEANCVSRIGLGRAVEYALEWGIERISNRVQSLAEGLRKDLSGIRNIRVEDRGRDRSGNIAVSIDHFDEMWVRDNLIRAGINTWVCLENSACLDMENRGISSLLRISPHYYNSAEELGRLCDVLDVMLAGKGSIPAVFSV